MVVLMKSHEEQLSDQKMIMKLKKRKLEDRMKKP